MKRSILALIIMAACIISSYAQQSAPTPFSKHAFGINYSNDFSSQFNNYEEFFTVGDHHLQYGFSVALLYQYRPVKWFSVETGLEYNSTKKKVTDGFPFDFEYLNFLDFSMDFTDDYTQRMNRLGIPVNLRWHLQKERWGFYALTGMAFTANTRRYDTSIDFESEVSYNLLGENDFKENFGIGLSAGLGAEYAISKHWLLRMEPRFRVYDIIKPERREYYEGATIKEHYWAMGLNLGIHYGFGGK